MFTLDASSLTSFQRCKRQYVISRDYLPKKWKPKSLLSYCLRKAIFDLSNGVEARVAAKDARIRFTEIASNAGLDFPGNSFVLAKDMCAVMEIVVRCISKLILLVVDEADDVLLAEDTVWKTLSWQDDSGQLHRWIFVDDPSEDRLVSEAHGWYVAGDIMLSRAPMTLHVVEIGRMRNGRFRSPWTTAYVLSMLPHTDYHFLSPKGEELHGKWTPRQLSDESHPDYDEWADRVQHEGLATRLVRHHSVKCPEERLCAETTEMVKSEALAMQHAQHEWSRYPMSRGACDVYSPCVYMPVCYSTELVEIDSMPLYVERKEDSVLA